MKKFEELDNGGLFSIGAWEIKPTFDNENFINEYVFNSYKQGLQFLFIKTSNQSCKELITGNEFVYKNKTMINDECGLYFLGNYVNEKNIRNHADSKYIINYFETAKELNNSKKVLVRK